MRVSWVVVVLVALVCLAAPPLRDQARLQWAGMRWEGPSGPSLGQVVLGQALIGLVLFALVVASARGMSGGSGLHWGWQFGMAVISALLAGYVGFVVASSGRVGSVISGSDWLTPTAGLWLGYALPAIVAIVITVPRAKAGGRLVIWRGHLRRVLPMMIAISALAYLGLGIDAAIIRSRVEGRFTDDQMKAVAAALGPAWERPKAPANAWLAEMPRLRQ